MSKLYEKGAKRQTIQILWMRLEELVTETILQTSFYFVSVLMMFAVNIGTIEGVLFHCMCMYVNSKDIDTRHPMVSHSNHAQETK